MSTRAIDAEHIGSSDMGNVSLVPADDPPHAGDLRPRRALALHRVARRRRHAPRRRDDAAGRDARRPDGARPAGRPGPRRRRLAGVPRRGVGSADQPAGTPCRPAARYHRAVRPAGRRTRTGGARTGGRRIAATPRARARARRPAARRFRVTDRHGHDPAAGGSEGWRAPDAFPDPDFGHAATAGTATSRRSPTSTCRPTSARRRSASCPGSPTRPRSAGAASTWRSSGRRSTTRSATGPAPASVRGRSARPTTRRGSHQLAPARPRRAVRGADRRRRRRRQHHPGLDRARPRLHLPQGPRRRRDGRDPDRPRWRPLDHLAVGDRDRRGSPARAASGSSTSTPTPTPRPRTGASWPATGRRCGGSSRAAP